MYELSLLAESEIGRNSGRQMNKKLKEELDRFDTVLQLILRKDSLLHRIFSGEWTKVKYFNLYVGGSRKTEENKQGISILAGNTVFDYSLKTRYFKDPKKARRDLELVGVTPKILSNAIILPGPNLELKKQFLEYVEWLKKAV